MARQCTGPAQSSVRRILPSRDHTFTVESSAPRREGWGLKIPEKKASGVTRMAWTRALCAQRVRSVVIERMWIMRTDLSAQAI
jgi:hypothetical protein